MATLYVQCSNKTFTLPSLDVDYAAFETTKEEKAKAYTIKKQWQATMKMYYGENWRKYNNFPEDLRKN